MTGKAAQFFTWVMFSVAAAGPLTAQEPESMPAETQLTEAVLTVEEVLQELERAGSASGLAEEVKSKVIEYYQQALADLQSAAEWQRQAAELDQLRLEAPEQLEAIRAELACPATEPSPEVPPDASLQQLEQRLVEEEARLKAARERAAGLDEERARRADRRTKVPEQIAKAREALAELAKQLPVRPGPSEPEELSRAQRTALQARKLALEAEVDACEKEVTSYDARGALLTARRDKAAREVAQAEQLVKAWQEMVHERRRMEAERAAAAATRDQRAAALRHPALQLLAEENAELANRRAELADKIERVTAELDRVSGIRGQVTADFNSVRSKVEVAGLTHAMGHLLRQRREQLPDIRRRQRSLAVRKAEISAVQVALIELEDARTELADIDRSLQVTLTSLEPTVSGAQRREIEAAARDLLQSQRGFLDALLNDYGTYFAKIVDLDTEEGHLIGDVRRFAAYIDERVLWIRSTALPGVTDLRECWEALRWLTGGANWAGVARSLWRSAVANPAPCAMGLTIFLVLLSAQRRLRAELRSIGRATAKPNARSFPPTLYGLVISALIAALWPAMFAFLGWCLRASLEAPDFAKAVAAGFKGVAVGLMTAELFRQILRPRGLADSHFSWPAGGVSLLRRHLLWLMVAGLPLVFVVSALEWTGTAAWHNSLGRLAFVVGQILLVVVAHRVLSPRRGVLRPRADRSERFHTLRHLAYLLGVGLPLLLLLLATMGYYYTALQLTHRLLASIWLILALLVADGLAQRWLLVSRRKLAMEQTRQRRAAALVASEDKGEPTPRDQAAEPRIDLSTISAQTRRLLLSLGVIAGILGLWFIWVDVLPALNILDTVQVWSTTETVTETTVGPDGTLTPRTVETSIPVTLADLALALLTLLIASIATRNVPGLLEMALLQHLPLHAGERYAITMTVRYVIIAVAVVMAASAIGVGWSKVQWLVAAMTVGLGFGLQEIVANFVSGLIILFERPIRMGDVVTVGNVTGHVSRIRTRATTIIDWDRKELVIPNKEFVTGQVVNWSLSDQVLRLVIKVGIAYGSDTRKARQILLEVAKGNSRVLPEPRPKAFFQEFGESSLNFELRAWVKDIDDWMVGRHELHQAIDDAFREAGVEIAFPQRDLHLRSVPGELPVVARESTNAKASPATSASSQPVEQPGSGD